MAVHVSGDPPDGAFPVPTHGPWPFTVAILQAPGDTLARVSVGLNLEPDADFRLTGAAVPNLTGVNNCYPLLGKAPIRPSGAAVAETLYVWGGAVPHGKYPPIC